MKKTSFAKPLVAIIFIVTIICGEIFAQQKPTEHSMKPVLGIAMSGGGAKGLSYIGMMEVLDSIGLPIQYIAGTSMGAIIGGFIALGYSSDYLLNLALNQDWMFLLGNKPIDEYVPMYEKKLRGNYSLTVYLNEQWGVLRAQRVRDLFTRLYSPFYRINDFSKFPIPFLCVAVDLNNGHAKEFNCGYFPDALMSSMAIPIAVTPNNVNGRLYVDGGMVNNFPVINLHNHEVEKVIGFDVQKSATNIDSINNLLQIAQQFIDINRYPSTKYGYENADIVLHPDIQNVNIASFDNTEEIINAGRASVEPYIEEIKQLRDSLVDLGYKPYKALNTKPLDSIYVDSYSFDGLVLVSPEYVIDKFQFNIPGYVTFEEIEKTLEILRGSYLFNDVIYRLRTSDKSFNSAMLAFEFSERSMTTVSAGFTYSNHRYITLMLNATFRNMLLPSSMLKMDLGLGLYPYLYVDYISTRNYAIEPGIAYYFSMSPARYYHENGSLDYRCTFLNSIISTYLESDFITSDMTTRLSLNYEHYKQIFPISSNTSLMNSAFLTTSFSFIHNNLNDEIFPTKGLKVKLGSKYVFYNREENFDDFLLSDLEILHSFSPNRKKISLNTYFYAGLSFGNNIPSAYRYYIGGSDYVHKDMNIKNFDGLKLMQKTANDVAILTETVQVNIAKNHYASLSAGIASLSASFNKLFSKGSFQSYIGLSYGLNTSVIPIKISFAKSLQDNGMTLSLNIGQFIR